MNQKYIDVRDKVASFLVQVLTEVCGGSHGSREGSDDVGVEGGGRDRTVCGGSHGSREGSDDVGVEGGGRDRFFDSTTRSLQETVISTISFPNKDPNSTEGKAHDIEVRVALTLFHRWKRKQANNDSSVVTISDLGLQREIISPRQFASLLAVHLEKLCQEDGIAHDVRVQPSGIISIVTSERSHLLRQAGKLPCPHCVQWFSGEKGLWWHQQQKHSVEHAEAVAVAAASTDQLALIPYYPHFLSLIGGAKPNIIRSSPVTVEDPFIIVKNGDLDSLKKAVQDGFHPADTLDRRGASPLMWAAGGGHIQVCRYLIEECGCDPNQGQQGKRSFSGRTALMWASRNGHFSVSEYLVNSCDVHLEAATVDGTTAFGWACWQGHLPIMNFLCEKGSNIHRKNSFGCNAVLWCAQGNGEVSMMKWLQAKGCCMTLVNNNGHGVVHKAAQRGQEDVCRWFFQEFIFKSPSKSLKLVGPDVEGYCPSDLAGMEGFEKFAIWLASNEMDLIERLKVSGKTGEMSSPKTSEVRWLYETSSQRQVHLSDKDCYIWEKGGGIRRMRSKLKEPRSRRGTIGERLL